MKRLTTDDAESILFGLNLFFVKGNEVWIRGGGPEPDYSDCTLTDWINRAAAAQRIELDADDPESLGDIMYDCLQYGADATEGILALLHAAAVQAAEMRGRLASIEDVLGGEYEIAHLRELVEADRDRTGGVKMKRYTKKPVTVEAIQWTGKNLQELKNFVGDSLECDVMDAAWEVGKGPVTVNVRIQTLEGVHHASVGDFIIKGVHGEFYPCKPDIFQETYVEAEE